MTLTEIVPQPTTPDVGDERLAHLVMKGDWPVALCGEVVEDLFNRTAPAMDRCARCLAIARERGLRLTGWTVS